MAIIRNLQPISFTDIQDEAEESETDYLTQLCQAANEKNKEFLSRLAYVCRHLDRTRFDFQHANLFSSLIIFRSHSGEPAAKKRIGSIE